MATQTLCGSFSSYSASSISCVASKCACRHGDLTIFEKHRKHFLLSSPFLSPRVSFRSFHLQSTSIKASHLRTYAKISEGDLLPSFSLKDQDGRIVSSSAFKGKPIVLYFYPADETPGCTRQACTFRDSYDKFKDSGAEVIGISSDSSQSHKAFADKYRLPFTLLTDASNKLRQEWGIPSDMFGMLPGRQTYIIDKKGVVRLIFNNQFQPERHVFEAMKIVEQMNVRGFGDLKKL